MTARPDDATTARAVHTRQLIDERLRALPPAARDELMQQYIAQAMSPSERFRAAGRLIQFGLRLRAAQQEPRDG